MAPIQPRKRKSDSSVATTPQRSPIKKRKMGISIAQKQALIDNLQLEITERARRLRAQYNVQAQQLRSRVEMRVNRIPTTLRKVKMGELFTKSLQSQQQQQRPPKDPYVAKPPPVPAKDGTSPMRIARKPVPPSKPASGRKRLRYAVHHVCTTNELTNFSDEIAGADKENQGGAVEHPKKKLRGGPAKEAAPIHSGQVLSTTSSNTRVLPRDRPQSPTKPAMSRPASPTKGSPVKSSNMISSMVERARGARPGALARNGTTSSTSSSNPGTITATGRARKATVASRPPSTTATRGRRKGSGVSESSEGSTTAAKKTTAKAAKPAPPAKRTVMGTIKSATSKKAPAATTTNTASTTKSTGRTLRKRAP
ncbi:Borealin N terminal-domain-containing protein [Biscogniauxia mediterranea]|nr:Borealin N terminal-domain-containing protein [Biscogniauxia mediterranea]